MTKDSHEEVLDGLVRIAEELGDYSDYRRCPSCRNYRLEKRWCGYCGGRGLVKAKKRGEWCEQRN